MIRVGDKVVPFFNMNSIGTVLSIETVDTNKGMLTTEGTTSTIRIAVVKLDNSVTGSDTQRFKIEDLLKADV